MNFGPLSVAPPRDMLFQNEARRADAARAVAVRDADHDLRAFRDAHALPAAVAAPFLVNAGRCVELRFARPTLSALVYEGHHVVARLDADLPALTHVVATVRRRHRYMDPNYPHRERRLDARPGAGGGMTLYAAEQGADGRWGPLLETTRGGVRLSRDEWAAVAGFAARWAALLAAYGEGAP